MKDWAQDRCTINGVSLRYFRSGGSSLPPLVLVHGFTDTALYYSRLAEALATTWDVIAYDCRGHGESDRANGMFTDQVRVDDLLGLVTHLGLDRPAMIGHSMGAATIALAVSQHAGLSRGIVLEDPAWWELPEAMSEQEVAAAHETRNVRNKAWHDSMVAVQAMTREEGLAWRRADSPQWSDRDIALSLDSRLQVELDLFTYFPTFESPWQNVVVSLDCPALLVIGETERGGIISVDAAKQAEASNTKLSWKQVEGAGHSIRYDRFDAFIAATNEFLEPLTSV
jgi:N-formylmaleamate deformylase